MTELAQILTASGSYRGEGINHENQKFTAEFSIEPLLGGRGARIHYKASGAGGEVYHEEISTVAPMLGENLVLNNLNTNMPGICSHVFKNRQAELGAKDGLVFAYNEPDQNDRFREEICLAFYANGDLSYRYSWGMPGDDFGFRSSVRLRRV